MRYETRNKLDELLLSYRRTVERSFRGPSETELGERHFHDLCNDVIRPVMEELSSVLREHGHGTRVYGHDRSVAEGGHSCPAELGMQVSPRGGDISLDTPGSDFVVRFSFESAQRKMLAHVEAGATSQGCGRAFDQHPIEGVTRELVEEELLEMLRYGFDCAGRKLAAAQIEPARVAA